MLDIVKHRVGQAADQVTGVTPVGRRPHMDAREAAVGWSAAASNVPGCSLSRENRDGRLLAAFAEPPARYWPTPRRIRMPRKTKPKAWLEVAVVNGGIRQAFRAINWAHSWIQVHVALGRDPSVNEVAEWWNQSRRTTFREQAAFRACFPTLDGPSPRYANPKQAEAVRKAVDLLQDLKASKRSTQQATDSNLIRTGLEPA